MQWQMETRIVVHCRTIGRLHDSRSRIAHNDNYNDNDDSNDDDNDNYNDSNDDEQLLHNQTEAETMNPFQHGVAI